jgi:hypothetical protein
MFPQKKAESPQQEAHRFLSISVFLNWVFKDPMALCLAVTGSLHSEFRNYLPNNSLLNFLISSKETLFPSMSGDS